MYAGLATASGSTWDILTWFQAGNNQSYVNVSSLLLNNVYNLTSPNFLPQASSPLLSGASFSGLSGFETVNYKGAFGTSDWTTGWTNFDPQQTDY